MRPHSSPLTWLMVMLIYNFILGGFVMAQTTLDKLEQQIRQRVSPSQRGTSVNRSLSAGAVSPVPSPPLAPSPDNITNNPAPVYLGVTADDRKDRGRGVRITEIQAGSPAEKAGMLKQDLVTALAGMRVRQLSDMTDILGVYQPADVVEFDILRDGAPKKIKITLGRPPAAPASANQMPEMIPLPPGELIVPEPGPAKTAPPSAKPIPPPAPINSLSYRETIEQLRNRVAELENRVRELEKELSEAQKNNK
jgi:hypothetical protein